MKSIKYILPLVLIGASVSSCDDYLDVKPVGKMIPTEVSQFENILNNTNTLDFFMMDNNRNCCYAMLGDNLCLSYNHAHYQYTSSHPNLEVLSAYVFYDKLVQPTVTPFFWTNGIYRSVAFFNNVIDGVNGLGATDDYSLGVIAQAKAGRAWVYMYAALAYGPMYDPAGPNDTPCIPLRTSGDPTVSNGPLATTQQIFDQVKEDLDFACTYAPQYSTNAARATRAAAFALRAEYHMFTRNWTEMLKDTQEAWRLALASKGSVDDLIYDYDDFYYEQVSDIEVEEGVDPRLYMEFRGPDLDYERVENRENLFYRIAPYGPMMSRCYMSDDWKDLFDHETDKRWEFFALDDKGYSPKVGDVTYSDGIQTSWIRDDIMSTASGITHPILLLEKAEAEARTGNVGDALISLNTLRKYRYSGENTDLPRGASMSQDELLNEILKERRREQHISTFVRTIDLKRYAFDSGKPWCKEVIVHKIGDKEYRAPINSKVFNSINIDNAILRYNPQWGIAPTSEAYQPYTLL